MSKSVKSVTSAVKNVAKNPTKISNVAELGLRTATGGLVGNDTVAGAMGFQTAAGGGGGGLNMAGAPTRPGFQSLLGVDPKTGQYNKLAMPTELQAPEVVGAAGRTNLSNRALAEGPSKQAQLMLDQQALGEADALGQVGKQGASELASAQGSVARTGGLRSGVGAMMASQNMRDQMMQKQQTRRGGLQDRLQIGLQDDQQKQSLLQNLVGQDLQSQQYNTGNVLGEKRAKDASDLAKYNAEMQAWAANKQGQAIANSGSGGGLLGFLGM
jgi:hypothetical protein